MWGRLRPIVLSIIVLGLIITFSFGNLLNSFYEQDEWMGIGNYLTGQTNRLCVSAESLLGVLIGEGRQLSSFITCFSYNYFPFNVTPLAVYRVLLHFINSVLVFILIKKTLSRTVPALAGALFFAVNAVSQSAVTWFAAHGTLPATTMVIVFLLALLKGIRFNEQSAKVNKKWLAVSFVALYVSFLFKQIAVFIFLLLPLAVYWRGAPTRKKLLSYLSKKYLLPVLAFSLFIGFWVFKFKSIIGTSALFLTGSSPDFYQTLLARAFLYPLTSFSLIFVPPENFLNFARFVTNIYYPFFPVEQFILIAQTVVLDMLAILLSFSLFILLLFLSRKTDDKDKKILWFFVLFSLLSFLPYVVIAKSFAYLESRYYYLAAVGGAAILAWVLVRIKEKLKNRFVVAFIFFVAALYIFINGVIVRNDVAKQATLAQERKNLLSQLTTVKPDLDSSKNIFLITGSDDFYLPGHKIPFQNGFGHILAVWYYHTGKIPQELIKSGKLFEIGSQGYYEYGKLGFGYFSDTDLLKETISKYNLPSSVIVALYYNAKNKSLVNTIERTLKELKEDAD